jgi:asparagine synthase (glutamine-hydrolysing)
MCGIAGIVNLHGEPASPVLIRAMTDAIVHRGPDGEGFFVDENVALGHRRLAIIDLSPAGHQPMVTADGRYVLTYNGEIYNFQEVRIHLEALGYQFHSRTDSEAVLYAYAAWGASCVHHLEGMFAFAIWDRKQRRLFLTRDRVGIKPLYYYARDGRFLFASEIKAILAHPEARRRVCYPALNEYFTFQNTLSDLTLFEDVRILPAGHVLTIDADESAAPVLTQYWDFRFDGPVFAGTDAEASDQLYQLFTRAVGRELVSDVPIAAYLSGGIDSSSITAIASRTLGRMATFTCGFDLSSASGLERGFDERANSEMLSNLLKTEHYEIVLHAGDMERIISELIWHVEDLRVGQCYPNYYLARLASKFVKVVLSGVGGDELFGGYPWRYEHALGENGHGDYYTKYYEFWQRLVPDQDKAKLFTPPTFRSLGGHSAFDVFRSVFRDDVPLHTRADRINASLYFELKTFLHGLLVVEDKISMAHSLETRVPFLDTDLVEFACRLRPDLKIDDSGYGPHVDENEPGKRLQWAVRTSNGKKILRKTMSRVIPPEVTERAKQGFSAPDASWFRGESIDYVNGLLSDRKARLYEYIEYDYVTARLHEHMTGRHNDRLFIWSLLSFEWWLRRFF